MITVFVPGKPQPQGSKKGFIINGKVVLVESAKGLKPWREKIRSHVQNHAQFTEITGAVHMTVSFYFKQPKSNNKKAHTQKPDIDKLTRGVLDALTGTVYKDDSQVTSISCYKYWGMHEGVMINIWEVDENGISIA